MSTALLITFPIMLLAILIAVAPVLLVSVREDRLSRGLRPPVETPTPRDATDGATSAGPSVAERQAVIVALEEAAIAVNRLTERGAVPDGGRIDVRLGETSDDLRRALVSLHGGAR